MIEGFAKLRGGQSSNQGTRIRCDHGILPTVLCPAFASCHTTCPAPGPVVGSIP